MPKDNKCHNRKSAQGPTDRTLDPLTLKLDPHNPRLMRDEEHSSQGDLLKIMIERFKIQELAESMISAGYCPYDPIIGYEQGGVVTVLEGNRRIATVQLLLRPRLAPANHSASWKQLSGRLSEEYREQMKTVNVRVFPSRDAVDLTAYIGFRHVTSVLKWPAHEKAKFVARLIEDNNWDYKKVAERVGSRPKHVERHYVAYRIVRQASDESVDGWQKMEEAFGVLLRALQAAGVSEFLGIEYPGDPAKSEAPIDSEHIQELKDFVEWTFGTDERSRILPDSRDLTKWGKILQSKRAIRYLKTAPRPQFERAWAKSGGQVESLVESLSAAADRLEESVPLVQEHENDDEVKDAVQQCAYFLAQILPYFPDAERKYFRKVQKGKE